MFFKAGFGALAAIALTTPAMANETATTTQITGVVDTAKAAPGSGDREFAELFASWRSMDKTGIATPAPLPSVSIPSRMPLDNATLTSSYGMRTHPVLGGRRNHNGIDLAQPTGTPASATAAAIISTAERFGRYRNYTQIEHGGELHPRYAHLSGYAISAGEQVRKGQLIGFVGSPGRSTGPHLHYEVRVAG